MLCFAFSEAPKTLDSLEDLGCFLGRGPFGATINQFRLNWTQSPKHLHSHHLLASPQQTPPTPRTASRVRTQPKLHLRFVIEPMMCGTVSYLPSPAPDFRLTSCQSPACSNHSSVGRVISQPSKKCGQMMLMPSATSSSANTSHDSREGDSLCQYATKSP